MENLLTKLQIYEKPANLQSALVKEIPEGAHMTITSRGRFYIRKDVVHFYKLMSYAPSFAHDGKNNWYLILDDNSETSFNVSCIKDTYFIHCNDLANRLLAKYKVKRLSIAMVPTDIPTVFSLKKSDEVNRPRNYSKGDKEKPFNQPATLIGHDELIKGGNYYDNLIAQLLRPTY